MDELAAFIAVLPATCSSEELDPSRAAWFAERYYDLMGSFLAQQETLQFKPLIAADVLKEDERDEFHQLCLQMVEDDALDFYVKGSFLDRHSRIRESSLTSRSESPYIALSLHACILERLKSLSIMALF